MEGEEKQHKEVRGRGCGHEHVLAGPKMGFPGQPPVVFYQWIPMSRQSVLVGALKVRVLLRFTQELKLLDCEVR